jgi:spermidine synthase
MCLRDPVSIEIEYVRQMMAWLLFLDQSQAILQLGLGAGALSRFCHARLAGARTTVVERSPAVLSAARQYFKLPPDDQRLTTVLADAGRFVESAAVSTYGVLQVDLYDQDARGPVLDSDAFYRECARCLNGPGVFVVNLFGDGHRFGRSFDRISRAFAGRAISLPKNAAGNVVALAFKGPAIRVPWSDLERRAHRLEAQLGLEAPQWVASLKRIRPESAECFAV